MNTLEKFLGSGFLTGYIPFASGTFGSLAALFLYLIPGFEHPYFLIPITLLTIIYGVYVGGKFEKQYGKDPAECTIDEVAGMWISLWFLPKSVLYIVVAFFIWRALDIFKPFPANRLENLPGGLGIMMDDVMSGIYTLLLMQIFIKIVN